MTNGMMQTVNEEYDIFCERVPAKPYVKMHSRKLLVTATQIAILSVSRQAAGSGTDNGAEFVRGFICSEQFDQL